MKSTFWETDINVREAKMSFEASDLGFAGVTTDQDIRHSIQVSTKPGAGIGNSMRLLKID